MGTKKKHDKMGTTPKKKWLNYQFYDYLTFDGYFCFVLQDEEVDRYFEKR